MRQAVLIYESLCDMWHYWVFGLETKLLVSQLALSQFSPFLSWFSLDHLHMHSSSDCLLNTGAPHSSSIPHVLSLGTSLLWIYVSSTWLLWSYIQHSSEYDQCEFLICPNDWLVFFYVLSHLFFNQIQGMSQKQCCFLLIALFSSIGSVNFDHLIKVIICLISPLWI